MVRFYLEKLVRDKVVEKCKADPQVLHTEHHQLDHAAYRCELRRKIHEEANEIPLGEDRLEEALQELADVQAVLDALRDDFGFSPQQVQDAVAHKAAHAGGFQGRYYIAYNDLAEDSKWVEVFRAQPEKYREEKSNATTIYCAGKDLSRANRVATMLESAGYTIPCDWFRNYRDDQSRFSPMDEKRAIAEADVLVYLWEPDQESARYEVGMAMALDKPIIVVHNEQPWFLTLPHVVVVRDDSEIIGALKNIAS